MVTKTVVPMFCFVRPTSTVMVLHNKAYDVFWNLQSRVCCWEVVGGRFGQRVPFKQVPLASLLLGDNCFEIMFIYKVLSSFILFTKSATKQNKYQRWIFIKLSIQNYKKLEQPWVFKFDLQYFFYNWTDNSGHYISMNWCPVSLFIIVLTTAK